MRDFAPIREQYRSSPDWGFITDRMGACLLPCHGPPQLWTMDGPGDAYTESSYGGFAFISGTRWGGPVWRFDNDESASITSKAVTINFPQPSVAWPGFWTHDWTWALLIRTGEVPSSYTKTIAVFIFYQTPGAWAQQTFKFDDDHEFICTYQTSSFGPFDLTVAHPSASQFGKWVGLVMTSRGSLTERAFYAGYPDGSFFGKASDAYSNWAMKPNLITLSAPGVKNAQAWNGEVGGFLLTKGVWTESEAKRWISNPFGWAKLWGQRIPPVDSCLVADAATQLAIMADVTKYTATKADTNIGPALDADTDSSEALRADTATALALSADTIVCPEDEES